MRFILFLFISILSIHQVHANKNLTQYFQKIGVGDWYSVDEKNGISFDMARVFLPTLFQFSADHTFEVIQDEIDQLGMRHMRLQHFYQNLPVYGSEMILHGKNDIIKTMGGRVFRISDIGTTTQISESEAVHLSLQRHPSQEYAWQRREMEATIKHVKQNLKETHFPKPTLYIYYDIKNQSTTLCYRIEIYSLQPLFKRVLFINAANGEEVYVQEDLHQKNVSASGETKYSGQRSFYTTEIDSNLFLLRETVTGSGISTLNGNYNDLPFQDSIFEDYDNYWNNVNPTQDEVAIDAHWGAMKFYHLLDSFFSFKSFNNQDAPLVSRVHVGNKMVNAFWDGTTMSYGDGDTAKGSFPLTTLDICGHEIGHGVVGNTSTLEYANEPGALNESFADIFGKGLEWFANPTVFSWTVGHQIFKDSSGIRNMKNPNLFSNPDTYFGDYWYTDIGDNGGVHYNSGVQNKWFQILVEGESGINDLGDPYAVDSIGFEKAFRIAFRNNRYYLTRYSQYADSRIGATLSAIDLYGDCSAEMISNMNAWHAVGLGKTYGSNLYDLEFYLDSVNYCRQDFSSKQDITLIYRGCYADSTAGKTVKLYYRKDGKKDDSTIVIIDRNLKFNGYYTIKVDVGLIYDSIEFYSILSEGQESLHENIVVTLKPKQKLHVNENQAFENELSTDLLSITKQGVTQLDFSVDPAYPTKRLRFFSKSFPDSNSFLFIWDAENLFQNYNEMVSSACYCAEVPTTKNLRLALDRRQTHSKYDYGFPYPRRGQESMLRVRIDSYNLSPIYIPLSATDDPITREIYKLDTLRRGSFQVCLDGFTYHAKQFFGNQFPSEIYIDNLILYYEQQEEEKREIVIYPNPAEDYLYFTFPSTTNEVLTFEIYDMLGRKIMTGAPETIGYTVVDVKNLSAGKYHIVIHTAEAIISEGFIKN